MSSQPPQDQASPPQQPKRPPFKRRRTGPKPSGSGEGIIANTSELAKALQKAAPATTKLVTTVPYTIRGLYPLCKQVISYFVNRGLVRDLVIPPYRLHRLMLTLIDVKIHEARLRFREGALNGNGFQPQVLIAPHENQLRARSLFKKLPTPLARYLNAIGYCKQESREYIPIFKRYNSDTGDNSEFIFNTATIRECLLEYEDKDDEDRAAFRDNCLLDLLYTPGDLAIQPATINHYMPADYLDGNGDESLSGDISYFAVQFENLERKYPQSFSRLTEDGLGSPSFLVNMDAAASHGCFPARIEAYYNSMSDVESIEGAMFLFGEALYPQAVGFNARRTNDMAFQRYVDWSSVVLAMLTK